MNNIETSITSLISGNRDTGSNVQQPEARTGTSFLDILNSRLNESDNNTPVERKHEIFENIKPETRAVENTGEKPSSGIDSKKTRIDKDNPENKPAENIRTKSEDDNKIKNKNSEKTTENRVDGKNPEKLKDGPDKISKKEKLLKELEELGVIIEDVDMEGLNGSEIDQLMKMLNNILNIINPSAENAQLKLEMKNLLSDIREMFDNLKAKNPEVNKVLIDKLKSNIKKFSSIIDKAIDEMKQGNSELKDILSRISNIVEKLGRKTVSAVVENAAADIHGKGASVENLTGVLNKIQSILSEAVKENSTGSMEGDGERDNSNSFNMNILKNFNGRLNNSGTDSRNVNNSKFSQQMQGLIDNAKVVVKDSRNGSFSVKLYPKHLGIVNVNLGLEHGVVNGRFLVENNEARNLLLDNLSMIREQLEEAGVSVGEFEVNINQHGEKYTGSDDEGTFYTAAGTSMEVVKEYDTNSMMHHDGEFNMVI